MKLPAKIQELVKDEAYQTDSIGMSGSSVLLFKDKVLKIQEAGEEAENERLMMEYLRNKLPVPAIYGYEVLNGRSYLLMEKCPGQMACSEWYMDNPVIQTKLLAAGLKLLWNTDISDCPSGQWLAGKLAMAEYNVKNNLVDIENTQPDTFGENGFRDPAALLQWLYDNRPEEEPVLSHGDYCLPNLFGRGDTVTGYIDLGKTGIACRWCDIALCYRSLSNNYDGKYGQKVHPGYDDSLLFRELGIKPDWDKINYYILLDELF